MLKCPECDKQMGWVGDSETYDDEVYVTMMECKDCNIEVNKSIGAKV